MKKNKEPKAPKRIAVLTNALRSGAMVCLHDGAAPDDKLRGYVVGLSDTFVLLHIWEPDTMCLNGYLALPLNEVISARVLDEYDAFPDRALKVKGIRPQSQPDILLLDFPGLLSSADAHFPLILLNLGYRYPDTCFVGRVERLTGKTVHLHEITPAARWGNTVKHRFKDITRVEFGGGYEDALWRVNQAERQAAAETE